MNEETTILTYEQLEYEASQLANYFNEKQYTIAQQQIILSEMLAHLQASRTQEVMKRIFELKEKGSPDPSQENGVDKT